MSDELIQRDLQHLWHPCSQMKDYESFKPLVVKKACGSYLQLTDGTKIIDAISSWWCKSLGHSHPRLKQALLEQSNLFEHVILANTTHETIVALSEKLARLSPNLTKVFYACDGSSAIEIALKMSIHSRAILGQPQRRQFIALENSYHGETCGALSVSDLGLYRAPYEPLLFSTQFLQPIPYVSGRSDPLWQNCEAFWPAIEKQLEPYVSTATALIVEPVVQGTAGMRIYSPDLLVRLRRWTQQHGIHLIADEIMTGIGRTGYALACQHTGIAPDFVCLGKGLTSGYLPLSATLMSSDIYALFYDDYASGKSFLHSHTHSGNALAARLALESLAIIEEDNIYAKVRSEEALLQQLMTEIATKTGKLTHVRGIGAIVAADLITNATSPPRMGYTVYKNAVKLGALLRTIGNTVYWLLPLNVDHHTLYELQAITMEAITAAYNE